MKGHTMFAMAALLCMGWQQFVVAIPASSFSWTPWWQQQSQPQQSARETSVNKASCVNNKPACQPQMVYTPVYPGTGYSTVLPEACALPCD